MGDIWKKYFFKYLRVDAIFEALVEEWLGLEEDQIRAKEQEFLVELNQPPSTEAPIPPIVASSSQAAPEITSPAPSPIIELTSPVTSEKSLMAAPTSAPTKKCPGRKLTLAPSPKRRVISSSDNLVNIPPSSSEPTLSTLYPTLTFSPISIPLDQSTQGDTSTFVMSFPEQFSLPSQEASYLIFAPPSIQTSLSSASSSSFLLPILLGGSFTTSWEETRPLIEGLTPSELVDRFSLDETKRWVANMSIARLIYDLSWENERLKKQVSETSVARVTEKISSLSTQLQEAKERLSQREVKIEILPSQIHSATSLSDELPLKLEKHIAETNQLSSQLSSLKVSHETELADKLSALSIKDKEIASLNASLTTTKTDASTKEVELKASQEELVTYQAGEVDALLPALMYKNAALNKSSLNKLGEELLQACQSNPTISTLGLLSPDEPIEGLSTSSEEERPFVVKSKRPKITRDTPLGDTFATLEQVPIVPCEISCVRVTSAPETIPDVSTSLLLLPPVFASSSSRERAKRTPCRRSSISSPLSAPTGSCPNPTTSILATSIPSPSLAVFPSSTPLPSSSIGPSTSTLPSSLFKQAQGLPSQLGKASICTTYGLLQLQGLLADSWLQSQASIKGTSISDRADHHNCQFIATKEDEKKTLELQMDGLNSQLRMETALKEKSLSDVSYKVTILEKLQKLHNVLSSGQAQDSASKDFALLQGQE
ncbi:putative GPI-anchored protein pfl2 [Zingiber officinale]|uniref:putative GPI-anchored protein pfl2 n=1 Tax=Zingiber officinale TaxID=94328 RepID=UPI001C4AC39C|nr:putative GPI-anchored protein pfl2 [Zingiber officinale]